MVSPPRYLVDPVRKRRDFGLAQSVAEKVGYLSDTMVKMLTSALVFDFTIRHPRTLHSTDARQVYSFRLSEQLSKAQERSKMEP
jgi:hypothetical protein